jgi:O-antigen ligase/tetratricopeptide (TPR) repeat protein
VLGALLTFAPLALGAVEPWSELVVATLAATLAVLLAARWIVNKEPLSWTWAYVPMGLFVLLLTIQIVPLPAAWVAAVSPQTLQLKSELLADLPDKAALLERTTLSFYPHATARDLRLVLIASVVFLAVVNVYRRPEQVKRLLTTVAGVGGLVAAVAILQNVSGAKEIYWSIYTSARPTAGPFVNYNNFSQFINLSIGAGLALLLIYQREIERGGGSGTEAWGESERRTRWIWWLGGMIAAGVVSVFLSTSRMGVMATMAAGLLAALLIHFRRRAAGQKGGVGGWVLAPIGLVVFAALLWAGFDKVYDRLATLNKFERLEGGRWQTLQDLPAIYRQFPMIGIGSGAHETFYPMHDRHSDGRATAHVENDYAQVLEETGAIGAALVALFLVVVLANLVRALRASSVSTRVTAIGLAFGLAAVLIHSASDFGQRLPAVACLSAVTCGLLVHLGRSPGKAAAAVKEAAAETQALVRPAPTFPRFAAGALTLLAIGWTAWGAARTYAAHAQWEQALAAEAWLEGNAWEGADADFAQLIDHASAAAALDPTNVEYRHGALIHRWHKASRQRDPQTGDLLLSEADLAEARQIVAGLHAARPLCPTYGANLSMAGQLELFVLGDPAGAAHVREGYRLSPGDPTAGFAAGLLDALEGRWDDSVTKFKKVANNRFADIVETYVRQVNRPDLALTVAGDDAGRLFRLAETFQALPADELKDLAKAAKGQAIEKIKARAAEPDAPAWVLASMGSISAAEGDDRAAIVYYKKALGADYGQHHWRLGLARSLARTGDVKEALQEARVCLRLRPQDGATRRLIQELSLLPGAGTASAAGGAKATD